MFVTPLYPGEIVAVGDIAVSVGELEQDRVRVTVNAPAGSRFRLMPEDIVVPVKITVARAEREQIHINHNVQVCVVKLELNRARVGFEAPRDFDIRRTWLAPDDDPWMLPAEGG
jgi:sRNA-binding carbon storage regulator CsrA